MAVQVPPLMQEASSQIPLLHSPKQRSQSQVTRCPPRDIQTSASCRTPDPTVHPCIMDQLPEWNNQLLCYHLLLACPLEELKTFPNTIGTINQRTHFITTEGMMELFLFLIHLYSSRKQDGWIASTAPSPSPECLC